MVDFNKNLLIYDTDESALKPQKLPFETPTQLAPRWVCAPT